MWYFEKIRFFYIKDSIHIYFNANHKKRKTTEFSKKLVPENQYPKFAIVKK
jgi:hypothetical protein